MLDRFIFGNVERISPEAPVPVVRSFEEKYILEVWKRIKKSYKPRC